MFRSIHAHKRISWKWEDGSFTHYYPNARYGHLNHKTPKQREAELDELEALAELSNAIASKRLARIADNYTEGHYSQLRPQKRHSD